MEAERNDFPHQVFRLSKFNVVLSADMSKLMGAFLGRHKDSLMCLF
jgi:hypothetical protein